MPRLGPLGNFCVTINPIKSFQGKPLPACSNRTCHCNGISSTILENNAFADEVLLRLGLRSTVRFCIAGSACTTVTTSLFVYRMGSNQEHSTFRHQQQNGTEASLLNDRWRGEKHAMAFSRVDLVDRSHVGEPDSPRRLSAFLQAAMSVYTGQCSQSESRKMQSYYCGSCSG